MEKNINILNEYMANLKVENNNLHNLYFNIIGPSYIGLQKKLKEYFINIDEFYCNIAFRIKMLGGYPYTSLIKIEDISTIKSMKSMNFNGKQIMEILDNDFNFLTDYTKDLIKIFNEENDYYTSTILREISIYLEKELWVIKSSLNFN